MWNSIARKLAEAWEEDKMNRGRAFRRHRRDTLKSKRLGYFGGWMKKSSDPKLPRRIGMAVDTPKHRSCAYCCDFCHGVKPKYRLEKYELEI